MPSVEELAERRTTTSREAFLSGLGGSCVLVRLDERGGKDEPAPWAFHGVPRTVALPPREDEEVDADKLRKTLDDTLDVPPPIGASADSSVEAGGAVSPEDETVTAVPPPVSTLRLPPARGAATVHVVPAEQGRPAVIGREADVAITERSISKRHAHIERKGHGFGLADLGSSNGTALNGRPLKGDRAQPLRSGDIVELGDVSLLFLDAESLYERLPDLTD